MPCFTTVQSLQSQSLFSTTRIYSNTQSLVGFSVIAIEMRKLVFEWPLNVIQGVLCWLWRQMRARVGASTSLPCLVYINVPLSTTFIFTARCYASAAATVIRLSVAAATCSHWSVCDVRSRSVCFSHKLEYFENNSRPQYLYTCSHWPQSGDLIQLEHPQIVVE